MTLVEFYGQKEARLRERLQGELGRLSDAIEAAAVESNQAEVDRLTVERDAVRDDLDLMDAAQVEEIARAGIQFPALPADFPALLRAGQQELEKWQKAERAIGAAIRVAGQVADAVSTIGKLVLKYGKFLI